MPLLLLLYDACAASLPLLLFIIFSLLIISLIPLHIFFKIWYEDISDIFMPYCCLLHLFCFFFFFAYYAYAFMLTRWKIIIMPYYFARYTICRFAIYYFHTYMLAFDIWYIQRRWCWYYYYVFMAIWFSPRYMSSHIFHMLSCRYMLFLSRRAYAFEIDDIII